MAVVSTDSGVSASISSVIADGSASARLAKTGSGPLVLSGTNTYSGGARIDGGTLQVSSDANLGAVAGGLIFNGGALSTTGDIASVRGVTLTAMRVFDVAFSTTLGLTGVVSGGELAKQGAGTLTLSGVDGYIGGTAPARSA
ncbi:autotransporter-associated beta strand repeat-containing protein [Kaistia algarum]|uniref:autotransporter-associated beta strand repeat-containing protein n=1 Tax=Kaistia algarum TaxID=2083279 RepID=UPI0014041DED|nr:autotransporter-associated beta strand repeat-containing protein [Kaistia algarum]MCX5515366.1 autotransporter-associated beta strand repeat-containing protein [Kaistia algarum]